MNEEFVRKSDDWEMQWFVQLLIRSVARQHPAFIVRHTFRWREANGLTDALMMPNRWQLLTSTAVDCIAAWRHLRKHKANYYGYTWHKKRWKHFYVYIYCISLSWVLGCIKIHFSLSSICLGPRSVPVGTGYVLVKYFINRWWFIGPTCSLNISIILQWHNHQKSGTTHLTNSRFK